MSANLTWTTAHGKVNTCDMIQRRRPDVCRFPNWYVVCRNGSECVNHLFQLCPIELLYGKWFQGVKFELGQPS